MFGRQFFLNHGYTCSGHFLGIYRNCSCYAINMYLQLRVKNFEGRDLDSNNTSCYLFTFYYSLRKSGKDWNTYLSGINSNILSVLKINKLTIIVSIT